MPATIRLHIIAARNLPVMDRSSELTDAFVEVKFGENISDKTAVFRKSLDPEWDNEKFTFEVEEHELQEEPLQIRVLDHDTYSSHDAIGKVYIDLKPLLNKDGPNSIYGWFPIYDTMHGIRGEIQIEAKLELISDLNTYRKSSCGVCFFCSPRIPEGYVLHGFHGFVEELLMNDDPEYQWIDKIRTPRTSNETRQKLFSKLSGELQRRIGLKVLEMGANCVIGYLQCFDLEGVHGIVVRGIGTAAYIVKQNLNQNSPHILQHSISHFSASPPGKHDRLKKPSPSRLASSVGCNANGNLTRGFSDPNLRQSSQAANMNYIQMQGLPAPLLLPANEQTLIKQLSFLDKMEYPFLTLQHCPLSFVKSLCGIVCSRSVKMHSDSSSLNDMDLRDKWWIELRNEIRTQMKSLGCNAVLGYTEHKSICEDVCVLSAMGTAVVVDERFFIVSPNTPNAKENGNFEAVSSSAEFFDDLSIKHCSICHILPSNDLTTPAENQDD